MTTTNLRRWKFPAPPPGWVRVLAFVFVACTARRASCEVQFEPTWKPPTVVEVRSQVLQWAEAADLDEQARLAVAWNWDAARGQDENLLDRLASTFAAAYPQAAELRRQCSQPFVGPRPPDGRWLAEQSLPPLAANNLRLYFARWLAEHGLYDECLAQLEGLTTRDVADPAALLFYRMAACQQLVRTDEARAALVQLLERSDEIPERYLQLAKLLDPDLKGLSDDSFDHISRRMNDIRRRLAYGRTGPVVQSIENDVLKSLDKKIDELEQQQQAQQQAQGASGGGAQPMQPMQDSQIAELKAPGNVDRKNIGSQSGWGDLPPKEREQALQQLGRDFPAHYRELIEDYFRELATESSK